MRRPRPSTSSVPLRPARLTLRPPKDGAHLPRHRRPARTVRLSPFPPRAHPHTLRCAETTPILHNSVRCSSSYLPASDRPPEPIAGEHAHACRRAAPPPRVPPNSPQPLTPPRPACASCTCRPSTPSCPSSPTATSAPTHTTRSQKQVRVPALLPGNNNNRCLTGPPPHHSIRGPHALPLLPLRSPDAAAHTHRQSPSAPSCARPLRPAPSARANCPARARAQAAAHRLCRRDRRRAQGRERDRPQGQDRAAAARARPFLPSLPRADAPQFCCWRYRPTKAYFMYTLKVRRPPPCSRLRPLTRPPARSGPCSNTSSSAPVRPAPAAPPPPRRLPGVCADARARRSHLDRGHRLPGIQRPVRVAVQRALCGGLSRLGRLCQHLVRAPVPHAPPAHPAPRAASRSTASSSSTRSRAPSSSAAARSPSSSRSSSSSSSRSTSPSSSRCCSRTASSPRPSSGPRRTSLTASTRSRRPSRCARRGGRQGRVRSGAR
jgi:hypothetical protein